MSKHFGMNIYTIKFGINNLFTNNITITKNQIVFVT